MSKQVAKTSVKPSTKLSTIEQVLTQNDLTGLTPEQRVDYSNQVCKSLKLNPLTRPFDYLKLNGKLILYATKGASEQLRNIHKVSIVLEKPRIERDILYVTANATTKDGRADAATGAVNIKGLFGEQLANAFMKAETKAKRRVTLSICGLGMLDESEIPADKPPTKTFQQPVPAAKPAPQKPKSELTKDDMLYLSKLVADSKWDRDQIRSYCMDAFGVESAAQLDRKGFDVICNALQFLPEEILGEDVPDEEPPPQEGEFDVGAGTTLPATQEAATQ